MSFGDCEKTVSGKRIPLKEKGRKITFINEDKLKIRKVKVDGCAIDDKGLRCDYLLIQKVGKTEYFVELKGKGVSHAIKQIRRSIEKLSINPKKQEKFSFVICAASPKVSPQIQNQKKEFKKNYNSKLKIYSSTAVYKLI